MQHTGSYSVRPGAEAGARYGADSNSNAGGEGGTRTHDRVAL